MLSTAKTSHEQQQQQKSQPADRHNSSPQPPASTEARQDAPGPSGNSSTASNGDEIGQTLDVWWDEIMAYFNRHRAVAAMIVWGGVFLFDFMDLHMPAEWLVFTFFSFSVFVQAFGTSIIFFVALSILMMASNILIFCLVPYSTTSFFSTIVVCMLLVRGIHGLDMRGWAITAVMSLSRAPNPWCSILPDYLQAPIAAYCSSFGILWLAYHNSRRLERLLDPLCLLLGVVPPLSPNIYIVAVYNTSIVVSWKPVPKMEEPLSSPRDATSPAEQSVFNLDARVLGHLSDSAGTSPISNAQFHDNDAALATSPTYGACMFGSGSGSNTPPTSRTASNTAADLHLIPRQTTGNSSASTSAISIGKLFTIDRKGLAEAQTEKYEIEINGKIVGENSSTQDYTTIRGLQPARMYQVRVWAISKSRGRAPSQPVFVNTLGNDMETPGTLREGPSDMTTASGIVERIHQSHAQIVELEADIEKIKMEGSAERARLQNEVADLKARRKEEDSAKGAQRERIHKLEAEKRRLDSEKARLEREIHGAMDRKQRAVEQMHEREAQAQECLVNAKALEEAIEREHKDYEQQQAELKKTIESIRTEVSKTKRKLDGLAAQQTELTEKIRVKRAALGAQEKKNMELDATIKAALAQRKRLEEDHAKITQSTRMIQSEIDNLVPKLSRIAEERKRLQAVVNDSVRMMDSQAPSLSSSASAIPIPVSSRYGAALQRGQTSKRGLHKHSKSSTSSAGAPTGILGADKLAPANTIHRHATPLVQMSEPLESARSSIPPHPDLGGIMNFWDTSGHPLSSSIPSIHRVGHSSITGPIDSINLFGAGGARVGTSNIGEMRNGIGATEFDYGRYIGSPAMTGSNDSIYLRRPTLWDSDMSSALSTTTAEASALSILKDTDLAYPTPNRTSSRSIPQYPDIGSRRRPMLPVLTNAQHQHRISLDRMLSSSLDSLDSGATIGQGAAESPSFRFNSLDLRAGDGYSWYNNKNNNNNNNAESANNANYGNRVGAVGTRQDGRESDRSSVVNERIASPGYPDISPFFGGDSSAKDAGSLFLSAGDLRTHSSLGGGKGYCADGDISSNADMRHVGPIGAPSDYSAAASKRRS